ncbi:type II toxin-antitoxin system ParD family antitoxin [Leptobacterium flavescens]|uniref:Type II toxin-antitoxin system ParD family antitoxin n=1 Tax=Leptobacterium flavescens TaxID=472055 RepID=A0A6P0UIY0_9FLAO|nr:type II toxin-antitoxin system ParD family antitoxin [Leptobacterium flavescens]NER13184.1 type II toxin-antitoxin system ParD family antitoxin [Leptobacterium flavescens]
MSTVRKSITFTEQQDNWIRIQVQKGDYTNDSEYIRDLVRRDQAQNKKLMDLNNAIEEGFNSGISDKSISDIRKEVKKTMKDNGEL